MSEEQIVAEIRGDHQRGFTVHLRWGRAHWSTACDTAKDAVETLARMLGVIT